MELHSLSPSLHPSSAQEACPATSGSAALEPSLVFWTDGHIGVQDGGQRTPKELSG